MSNYYAVNRNSEYLAHYGIKGMHWGVRKAIDAKNSEALTNHYRKALRKLGKLKKKADILDAYQKRREGPVLLGASSFPLTAGSVVASTYENPGDKALGIANVISGAGMAGLGAYETIVGNRRTKSKHHDKAVAKVNEWQKEMKKAFKDSDRSTDVNSIPDYKDEYTLYEYGMGKDANGKQFVYRAPTVSVKGSDLVRDKNTKGKDVFRQRMVDPPQIKGSRLVVHSPSGGVYSSEEVHKYLKSKKKRS